MQPLSKFIDRSIQYSNLIYVLIFNFELTKFNLWVQSPSFWFDWRHGWFCCGYKCWLSPTLTYRFNYSFILQTSYQSSKQSAISMQPKVGAFQEKKLGSVHQQIFHMHISMVLFSHLHEKAAVRTDAEIGVSHRQSFSFNWQGCCEG